MKNNWILAALSAISVLTVGCSELPSTIIPETPEETTPPEAIVTLTVSAATKGDDSATKIAYGATDATWEDGDKIFLIKSDRTTITLTLADGAGEVSGTFTSSDPASHPALLSSVISKPRSG